MHISMCVCVHLTLILLIAMVHQVPLILTQLTMPFCCNQSGLQRMNLLTYLFEHSAKIETR